MSFSIGFSMNDARGFSALSEVRGGRTRLLLDTPGIIASGAIAGSDITGWQCSTGLNTPALPSPTPPTLYLAGPVPGVRFSATNRYLRGDFASAVTDNRVTAFVGLATLVDTTGGGGRAWVLELTVGTASGTSDSVLRAFTSAVARREQNENSAASISFTTTDPNVQRLRFTSSAVQLFIDGEHGASSVVPSPPAHAATKYTLGQRRAGDLAWNDGVLFFVHIVEWDDLPQLDEEERLDALWRAKLGIASPETYPITPPANSGNPPRWVVPAIIPATVGTKVRIFKDGMWLLGAGPTSGITITSELPLCTSTPDRFEWLPTAAGSFDVTITGGANQLATTLDVKAYPGPGVPQIAVATIGHSNAARARSGWMQVVGDRLGARILFVGTRPPAAGYSYNGDGVDSTWWVHWATSAVLPGGIANPLFHGGVLDLAHWISVLAAPPKWILFDLGINESNATALVDIPTVHAAAMGYGQTIFDAARAELPDVGFGIGTQYPLSKHALPWGSQANQLAAREKMHLWAELTIAHFEPLAGDGYKLIHTMPSTDAIRGYPNKAPTVDGIHHNQSPGHEEIADVYEAWMVHTFW